VTFYYERRPPLPIKPPVTPLPDYESVHKLTGDIYLKYPLQPSLTPIHLGAAFRAQVELNTLMLEINSVAYRAGEARTTPPTLSQALGFYKRLDTWFKALPKELQPSWVVMPHHLQIQ
jgi:hypothetical protein